MNILQEPQGDVSLDVNMEVEGIELLFPNNLDIVIPIRFICIDGLVKGIGLGKKEIEEEIFFSNPIPIPKTTLGIRSTFIMECGKDVCKFLLWDRFTGDGAWEEYPTEKVIDLLK